MSFEIGDVLRIVSGGICIIIGFMLILASMAANVYFNVNFLIECEEVCFWKFWLFKMVVTIFPYLTGIYCLLMGTEFLFPYFNEMEEINEEPIGVHQVRGDGDNEVGGND